MNDFANNSLFESTGIFTQHALLRMSQRGISTEQVLSVMAHGRKVHARGAVHYVFGKKEVQEFKEADIDFSDLDGIHVVCDPSSEYVLTTYKNDDFRGLKPKHRRSRNIVW